MDHSVQVDYFGTEYSYDKNVALEYERNRERYELLKWAQKGLKISLLSLRGWESVIR
ncbi:hypothetical protein KUH03_38505 [Sphingobacterium sp. E70]|nr:hypothetical protein KUH03_38505 [Sphingobacterium sp. E70]